MYDILSRLKSLDSEIKIAIVGMGKMGTGLLYQASVTPGIKCVSVCDKEASRAIASAKLVRSPHELVANDKEMKEAIERDKLAICKQAELAARCEAVDVFIEATSSIKEGARYSIIALENNKHLVLMNSEIDLIFGPYFKKLAEENDVVYTSVEGDQYGVIQHLINEVELWGLQIVMAGNIKGYLDRYSNPTKIIPEADKRNLDYKMATSYTDGTKLGIEMALVANANGYSVLEPGMYGPPADHVKNVFDLFDIGAQFEENGPFVDYVIGAQPGGGVFIIGRCDNPYQKSMLSYYKMGEGPFYLFYRPYHLCHIEAMESVARAYLDKESLLQPNFGFQTNVFAYAKKDLKKGQTLDGIGGYTSYGVIENCSDKSNNGLPLCLADNLTLSRSVAKDEKIRFSDVNYDQNSYEFKLYLKALQESEEIILQ